MNKISRNFISILQGNFVGKIVTFIFFLVVARWYGEEVFGIVNFANSIITYFIMIASMGLQNYAIVCIAKDKQHSELLFNKVINIRIILAIISISLLFITISLSNIMYENKVMTLLYGGMIITNALNIEWYFNAIQEMQYISKSMIIQNISSLLILTVFYVLNISKSMYIIPLALILGSLLASIYLLYIALKNIKYKFLFSIKEAIRFIKYGFPFFFSGIFATINSNIDIIILGIISTNSEVGLYSSAYKIINVLIIVVTLVFTPIYPVMIELINLKKWDELNSLMIKVKKYVYALALPLLVGGIILGKEVIIFLFGIKYSEAGLTFKILIVYICLLYIREIYGYILTASGNQKSYMTVVSISSAINVIMNLILIPQIGIVGAALTTLFSEIINLILMRRIAYKNIPLDLKGDYCKKIIISALIMGGVAFICNKYNIHLIITIVLSSIIYLIIIIKSRVISKEDIKLVIG